MEEVFPASHVPLRSVSWDNVVIIDTEKGKSLAELDWHSSHTMLHDQAIYQHDGEAWEVVRFDYENHKAFVRKVEPDYYTEAMTFVEVALLEEAMRDDALAGNWESGWGEVSVVEKVQGYKKIKFHTHENAGYGEVRLPEMHKHTTAFWLKVPEKAVRATPFGAPAVVDALHGIGRALLTVSALALMCDPRDLAIAIPLALPKARFSSREGHPETLRAYEPTLFLYEPCPGGTGLAERIFEQRAALLLRADKLIATCPCSSGGPACVGPIATQAALGSDGTPLPQRKAVAKDLLASVTRSPSFGLGPRQRETAA
jgi:DEAD/DEAH box helicase domain-containing protein